MLVLSQSLEISQKLAPTRGSLDGSVKGFDLQYTQTRL